MPFPVVSSAVTRCGSLFAVALANNNVVIHDRKTGTLSMMLFIILLIVLLTLHYQRINASCGTLGAEMLLLLIFNIWVSFLMAMLLFIT